MIVAQGVKYDMGTGTSVIDVAQQMELVYTEALDDIAERDDEVVCTTGGYDGVYDDIHVGCLVGVVRALVKQLLDDMTEIMGECLANFGTGIFAGDIAADFDELMDRDMVPVVNIGFTGLDEFQFLFRIIDQCTEFLLFRLPYLIAEEFTDLTFDVAGCILQYVLESIAFAMEVYGDDPCEEFLPKLEGGKQMDEKTQLLTARMHKAISVIQFKEEAVIYDRQPSWDMSDRKLFDYVDYERGICTVDGKEYAMRSCHFPTVDPKHPNELTHEEKLLIGKLHHSFAVSEKLHKHIRTILSHGCMYAVYNSNLLFHASCPLNDDGTLKEVEIAPGKKYAGLQLMHYTGMMIRSAFTTDTPIEERQYAIDYFLYLWCGKDSPLFDKSKMATFERYFLTDKDTFKEEKGAYFRLRDNEAICDAIMDSFSVEGTNSHIINGHVTVHAASGENHIKANGKLMVIDGGFSQPYHKETGIAGYTLVYHSRGFQLVQHEPFTSAEDAIRRGTDIKSTTQIVEMSAHRMLVADTDKGKELREQIGDLKELLYAYRHGIIKEKKG